MSENNFIAEKLESSEKSLKNLSKNSGRQPMINILQEMTSQSKI